MASAASGMMGSSSWMPMKQKKTGRTAATTSKVGVCRASSNPYRTLRIRPDASESEVKKAFRQLALKYHPDVCKGNNCGVKFQNINEAYDIVMNNLRAASEQKKKQEEEVFDTGSIWDNLDDWMAGEGGCEGGYVPDYAAHVRGSC